MVIFDFVAVAAKNLLSSNLVVAVKTPILARFMENVAIPRLLVTATYVFPSTFKKTFAPYIGLPDLESNVAVTFFALLDAE